MYGSLELHYPTEQSQANVIEHLKYNTTEPEFLIFLYLNLNGKTEVVQHS